VPFADDTTVIPGGLEDYRKNGFIGIETEGRSGMDHLNL
jgi:hypothetical protein